MRTDQWMPEVRAREGCDSKKEKRKGEFFSGDGYVLNPDFGDVYINTYI